jgi:hypothetical protein
MRNLLVLVLCALALPATAHAAVLRVHDCGRDVAGLQRDLARLSYETGGVDGCFGPATRYAVRAFQRHEGLVPDGIAGPVTLGRLAHARRPHPRLRTADVHAEVDLERQLLFLVRHDRVRETVPVSTGRRGYETPVGTFRVYRKELRSWSVPYRTWMPWASYFTGGVAVHEGVVGADPVSHGCVHVPAPFAAGLYRSLASGTTVLVY